MNRLSKYKFFLYLPIIYALCSVQLFAQVTYKDSMIELADIISLNAGENKVLQFNYSNVIEDLGTATVLAAQNEKDIKSMAVSSDNKYFAQGSVELILWDINTKEQIHTLRYHKNYITSIVFSPDNTILISGDRDGIVCIVDVASGRLLKKMYIHQGGIGNICYSRDGNTLFTAGADRIIRLWATSNWRSLRKIVAKGPVKSIALSYDDKWMAICLTEGLMQMYDLETSIIDREYGGDSLKKQEFITKVIFTPTDKYYTLTQNGNIIVWKLGQNTITYKIMYRYPNSMSSFIDFCPGGKRYITSFFATDFDKGFLRSWDMQTDEPITSLKLVNNVPNFYVHGVLSSDKKNMFMRYQDAKNQTSDVVMYSLEMSHLLCDY